MTSLKDISDTLKTGIVLGLALIWIGLIPGLKPILYVGILTVILTPPTALLLAFHYLYKNYENKVYAAFALIDAAIIYGSLLYHMLH